MYLLSLTVLLGLSAASATGTATRSPVENIVKLLETLKEKTTGDGKAEQQIYDKYACWCETTSKRKADDIVDAQNNLRSLGQRILKLKGKVATRTAEIEELSQNIQDNENEQEQITSVRQKQNAAWADESAETKQALSALQDAINVLSSATTGDNAQKHGGTVAEPAMIQENQMMRAKYAVNAVLQKLPSAIGLAPGHMALLSEFTTAKAGFAPQSATIQGMLGDMYLTFSNNLESATMEEANQNHDFEDLFATLEEENNKFKKIRSTKQTEKAEAEAALADTTKMYEDTEEQMNADIEFFGKTKAACLSKHEEMTTRVKMRNQELEGINKALELLTGDDARELFSKSIKPGVGTFLQIKSDVSSDAPASRAYNAVKAQAKKAHSVRLAALAVQIRTSKAGHFDKVIGEIDKMLETLEKEGAADLAKKTQCLDEYQSIARTVKDLDWKIKNNEAKIDNYNKLIELRRKDKADTIASIEETQQYIKDIKQERKDENEAYKEAKKDDEAAAELLEKAKAVFVDFYKKQGVKMGPIQGGVNDALLQEPEFTRSEDDAPDATLSGKGNNKNASKTIISLFSYIIEDLYDELAVEKKAEAKSQAEFEEELATADKLEADLTEKKVGLEGTIAKRIESRREQNEDMGENNDDRDNELGYQAKIKPDCDWIIKAFDSRAQARAAEADGLTTAKEFLAGKTALLQGKVNRFDDGKLSSLGFLGIAH